MNTAKDELYFTIIQNNAHDFSKSIIEKLMQGALFPNILNPYISKITEHFLEHVSEYERLCLEIPA